MFQEGLYGLVAHVAGRRPYDLHDLAHVSGVGSVLDISISRTTSRNGTYVSYMICIIYMICELYDLYHLYDLYDLFYLDGLYDLYDLYISVVGVVDILLLS